MDRRPQTAIVADLSLQASAVMAALLSALGCTVVLQARNSEEVIEGVQALSPDLLALDTVLPGLDGISTAERLLRLPLVVRPGIILTSAFSLETSRAKALEDQGCTLLNKPVSAEALRAALARVEPIRRRIPRETEARLQRLLDQLGLPQHPGRRFLEKAIILAWQDARLVHRLTRELYPLVGTSCGAEAKKVERDMRHAIEYAWKYGRIEDQYALFGGTIDAQRGKPTCGEMIARLADILRLEG